MGRRSKDSDKDQTFVEDYFGASDKYAHFTQLGEYIYIYNMCIRCGCMYVAVNVSYRLFRCIGGLKIE